MRIRSAKEYQEVYENQVKIVSKGLVIYFQPDENFKVGIVVSKKVDKKAVVRNKIKRKLREIVRLNQANKKGKYVLIARDRIKDMNFDEIQKEFLKNLELLTARCLKN